VRNYEDVLDEYYNTITNKDIELARLEFLCEKLNDWHKTAINKGLMNCDDTMLWV
jgi:hypothetical protein